MQDCDMDTEKEEEEEEEEEEDEEEEEEDDDKTYPSSQYSNNMRSGSLMVPSLA